MVSGFFLGGAAEGMDNYDKRAIDREKSATTDRLQSRGLDIQEKSANANIGIAERAQTLAEKNAERAAGQDATTRADKAIADTMAIVAETVKQSTAAGRDPASIKKAVSPLLDSVGRLATGVGRDPAMYAAQVDAMITNPTAVEAKTVEGEGKAAAKIAETKALNAAGYTDENGGFKDKKDKVSAENSLRDDYLKNSGDYIKIRDAKNRLDNIEKTGAGDVALVFQFMKILDPGSTVREGEFATASNAAGVPAAVMAQYNKAIGGGVLADKARNEIKTQAERIYQAQSAQHDRLTNSFAAVAKRQGLTVDNVIIDTAPNPKKAAPAPSNGLPPPPDGFTVVK